MHHEEVLFDKVASIITKICIGWCQLQLQPAFFSEVLTAAACLKARISVKALLH
jgi:hypothetical protein